MNLNNLKHIFFLGIGGIGMSALARYFKLIGVQISGYDRTSTDLTLSLESEGIDVFYQDDIKLFPNDIDVVVYTPAIPPTSALFQYVKENNYRLLKRSEVLGELSQNNFTIAIGGTHGKTTTTAIVSHLLYSAGIKTTAFVGGIMSNYDSNFLYSGSDVIVVEADEFDHSFLCLNPNIACILSMDADHLDIYKETDAVKKGFKSFANNVMDGGNLFLQKDTLQNFSDEEWRALNTRINTNVFGHKPAAFQYENIQLNESGHFSFDLKTPEQTITGLEIGMPGEHNISNATVAISIALLLGVGVPNIKLALKTFKGIKRRFEFILNNKNVVFIDDYAHHPSELTAVISAAKKMYSNKKITCIFQPHLYSRTRDFAIEFAQACDLCDEIILMDIYPARELPIEGVSSQIILNQMKNKNKLLLSNMDILTHLKSNPPEVLMTLGAGDIDLLVKPIKDILS